MMINIEVDTLVELKKMFKGTKYENEVDKIKITHLKKIMLLYFRSIKYHISQKVKSVLIQYIGRLSLKKDVNISEL